MTNFGQVKVTFLLLNLAFVVLVNSQEESQLTNKKNVSLHDPSVDQTVRSALENGSVSEVVVRKDLLLFPVNAPNLVIAHTQEIHAVPHTNGSNTTDGKPTAAEVAEVNEYSLSQLVSTNDTDYDNETKSESSAAAAAAVTATPLLRGPQNTSVLEPGKLLEIVSGFNLSHGLATETVPLPDEVQNISIPKQSIEGLLSKSIQQSDAPLTTTLPPYDLRTPQPDAPIATDLYPYPYTAIAKRSADSEESNSSDDPALLPPYPYVVRKRSIDSDEDGSDDDSSGENSASNEVAGSTDNGNDTEKQSGDSDVTDNDNNSTITGEQTTAENVKRSANDDESSVDDSSLSTLDYESTSTSSTMPDTGLLDTAAVLKRSVDLDAKDADNNSSSTTENHYYDYKVENSLEKLDSTTNNSTLANQSFPIINGALNRVNNMKEQLRKDSHEDMEVAEDIVFRPLFRYRQETRLRQQSAASRKSSYRKSAYNAYDSDYDNGDY